MKTNSIIPLLAAALLLPSSDCLGQGALTPPGAPAPTQKSLQQIWDELGVHRTQITALQQQSNTLAQQNNILMQNAGVSLSWQLTTVDATGDVGAYASLAASPSGQPAIAYYDASNRNLKFASYNGSTWTVEIARAAPSTPYDYGKYASLAYSPAGEPAISFFADAVPSDLAFSKRSGTSWTFETVDGVGTFTIYGPHTSLAYGPSGQPSIAYQDASNQDLKFASYNGNSWSRQVVTGTGNVGEYASLGFLPAGTPVISFYNASSGDLVYASYNGSSWSLTTVDSAGDVGRFSSLAIGPDGLPAIAYYDVTNMALKYARYTGTSWIVETAVDEPTDVGKYASLAFAPSGNPAISCYSDGTPKDMLFVSYNGSSWHTETVDGVGTNAQVGQYSSLVFSSSGHPMIAYYDATNGDLKFALKGIFPPAP